MPHPDGSQTIEELHARYDGPIPKHMREAANAGGYLRLARNKAWAKVRFWHEYLRTNRRIRKHHIAMNAERGFPSHPDQERVNAADLKYAMKNLHRWRKELRLIERGAQ